MKRRVFSRPRLGARGGKYAPRAKKRPTRASYRRPRNVSATIIRRWRHRTSIEKLELQHLARRRVTRKLARLIKPRVITRRTKPLPIRRRKLALGGFVRRRQCRRSRSRRARVRKLRLAKGTPAKRARIKVRQVLRVTAG